MLTVITALSRPGNFDRLAASVLAASEFLQVQWFVLCDCRSVAGGDIGSAAERWRLPVVVEAVPGDCTGAPQKNRGVRIAPGRGWVYFLDDDNLIHPSLPPVLAAEPPGAILLFPQVDAAGESVRGECEPERCSIDLAQFAVPAAWAVESSFPADEHDSDWFYLSGLLTAGRPRRWVSGARAFYNALAPPG